MVIIFPSFFFDKHLTGVKIALLPKIRLGIRLL